MNVCARQVVRLTPRRMCSHISRSLPYDGKRCRQPSGRGPNIGGMYLRRRRCRHGHPATSCSTERSRSFCNAADSNASHRLNGTVSRACAVIDASCKATDTRWSQSSYSLQNERMTREWTFSYVVEQALLMSQWPIRKLRVRLWIRVTIRVCVRIAHNYTAT